MKQREEFLARQQEAKLAAQMERFEENAQPQDALSLDDAGVSFQEAVTEEAVSEPVVDESSEPVEATASPAVEEASVSAPVEEVVEEAQPQEETDLEKAARIAREKQKLCLKGDIILHIHGKELDLGRLSNGIEFFADEIDKIGQIQVRTPFFTTVENYTSWLRCCGQEESFFYLGGYATRSQRDFLKKIYYDNPSLTYRHFGDIDAGGLYIHEHLCRVTGIPFQMHLMSRAELEDVRFQSCLCSLSDNDRLRLESLEKQEVYRDLTEYMLERGVKLEQEIVSYYEY